MNLRELLKNWEDQDISAYYLACCLGIIEFDDSFAIFRDSKHIFWTGNSIGDFLYEMLRRMVEIGMLEIDDDESQYRWNQSFKQPKETFKP
jgi:hypothetical protein